MAASSASKFHQIPDELWQRIEPLLPIYKKSYKGGRPRLELRSVVTGILYVLRTGCQWKAVPQEFGSGSAIHMYFQEWVERGVFLQLWRLALEEYDELLEIDWQWQSLDGAMTKTPLGGEKNGKNPTDRGKLGVKRSTLTDGRGVPLSVAIAGANVHDQKLVAETFGNLTVRRPRRHRRRRQHLCADKGYDAKAVRTSAARCEYVVHIPRKGDAAPRRHGPHARARRWGVERTHSWTNHARRLLIRWEKSAANYLGFLHLQFALTTWRVAGVLG